MSEMLTGWFVKGTYERNEGCFCPRTVVFINQATARSCRYDDDELCGPYMTEAEAEAAYSRLDEAWVAACTNTPPRS